MSEKRYIYNQSEDGTKANILIDGEIDAWWGTGLQTFAKDIANSNASEVMLQINSGGGSVTEGQAIAAYIKGSPYNINTSILGLCASIATFIAMAGKTTSISKGSLFMIHNASGGVWGESEDMRKTADLLDTIDAQLTELYLDTIENNGKLIDGDREKTRTQLIEWQNNETWFTAEQAVEHGFIQKLTEGVEFVNKAQAQNIVNICSKYKNVPTEFLNNFKNIANMADEKPIVSDDEKETNVGILKTIVNLFKSDEGKKVLIDANNQAEKDKEAALVAARALLKENGELPDPVAKVEAEDKPEAKEDDKVADLQAKLEAAEAEAKQLKLEKEAAPTARATKPKENTSPFNKEELAFFNKGADILLNRS